jgi:hypothetical protein
MPSPTNEPSTEPRRAGVGQGVAPSILSEEEKYIVRQRSTQLYLVHLYQHASSCVSLDCQHANCEITKSYLKHALLHCNVKASGGCKVCKRVGTLLRIQSHLRQDKASGHSLCRGILQSTTKHEEGELLTPKNENKNKSGSLVTHLERARPSATPHSLKLQRSDSESV